MKKLIGLLLVFFVLCSMIYITILSVETVRIVQNSNIQTSTDMLGIQRGANPMQSNSNYGRQMSNGRDFVETTAGLNMKMVYVEGGSFVMGCTGEQGSDCYDDEKNTRRVTLDGFYIGETEITQAQWRAVMGTNPSNFNKGDNYPVERVSWNDAQAFCQELSRMTGKTYLLPTEAQWEYAARGGKKAEGSKYSGSYAIDAVAWYSNNSGSSTHPVKSKRANVLGLYDMSGNVWEWCSDFYGSSYNTNETNNPTGPSAGSYRVERGGSWSNDALCCRVSYRSSYGPDDRVNNLGFRVVVLP